MKPGGMPIPKIHNPSIHPRLGGHFQSVCGCGFTSDTLTTYAEAWLAGSIHQRTMHRTSDRTREPRWLAAASRRGH